MNIEHCLASLSKNVSEGPHRRMFRQRYKKVKLNRSLHDTQDTLDRRFLAAFIALLTTAAGSPARQASVAAENLSSKPVHPK
ncbi:hypothetical protein EVAR_10973_1 [Eumeta japonica]|uniref:Uncharacterized protein n=1 Tax=Eumeta variegata TaxID=151549 RepID=A0A4C1U764_EUMVA|nr:hypothetical protein EVAR_10973_1 [Eumeta japonica]